MVIMPQGGIPNDSDTRNYSEYESGNFGYFAVIIKHKNSARVNIFIHCALVLAAEVKKVILMDVLNTHKIVCH